MRSLPGVTLGFERCVPARSQILSGKRVREGTICPTGEMVKRQREKRGGFYEEIEGDTGNE